MPNWKTIGGLIVFLSILVASTPFWLKTSFNVKATNNRSPVPVKLFAEGKLLAEFHEPETKVEVRKIWVGKRHPIPQFSAQVLSPCGWRDAKTSFPLTNDELLVVAVESPEYDDLSIWVDNRQGSQAELTIGEANLQVSADWSGRIGIPTPTCEAVVRLNGREAGIIPRYPRVPAYLLDVSGKHCYQAREVHYVESGYGYLLPPPRPLLRRRLQGKRLYELESGVHYFLEPAPESIEGFHMSGSPSRILFVLSDCR